MVYAPGHWPDETTIPAVALCDRGGRQAMKQFSSTNVYDAALQRLVDAYKEGHRLVVAFSAGKDSTAVLEMAIQAARITGNLPVEAWMRDEEIMYPGTYEY